MKIQRSSNEGKTWLDTSEDWLTRTMDYHYDSLIEEVKKIEEINEKIEYANKEEKYKKNHQKLIKIKTPLTSKELLSAMKKKKGTSFYPLGKNSVCVRIVKEDKSRKNDK